MPIFTGNSPFPFTCLPSVCSFWCCLCRQRSEEHTSELQSQFHLLFPLVFFNDTATTEIYTLSLHDALPICRYLPEIRHSHLPVYLQFAHFGVVYAGSKRSTRMVGLWYFGDSTG